MRGLYAIGDVQLLSARRIDVLRFAKAVLEARPAAFQLRAKDLPPREFLALLRALQPMCRNARVPLVANDRVDLAALAGCDLVHIGQEDLPLDIVRRLAPTLGVGVSTHNPDQLARALGGRPSYVAYGPVFPTNSKTNPDPVVGLAGLAVAQGMARRTQTPLVAVGGISGERGADVASLADAGAVISALVPAGEVDFAEVTARAHALHASLLGAGAPGAAARPSDHP